MVRMLVRIKRLILLYGFGFSIPAFELLLPYYFQKLNTDACSLLLKSLFSCELKYGTMERVSR